MASQELVSSQEVPMPAVAAGARGRAQTKRTKLVEQTVQLDETPAGDEVEIHQVRQVQEVVKKVAVVRRGRRSARQRQEEEAEEQGGEEEEQEEEEAPPPRRVTRRMDAELDDAMQRELEPISAAPATARRTWRKVVVEGGTAPQSGSAEQDTQLPGGAVPEPLGSERQVFGRGGGGARTRTQGQAIPVESPEAGIPPTEPILGAAEEGGEAEDALQEGGAEEEEEEGGQGIEEFATAPDELRPSQFEATPDDLAPPNRASRRLRASATQAADAGGPMEQPTPTSRKRKAPGADVGAAAAGAAPSGSAGGLRGARRGGLFATSAQQEQQNQAAAAAAEEEGEEVEEEEEAEEEAPAGKEAGPEELGAPEPAGPAATARGVLGAVAGTVGGALRSMLTNTRGGATQEERGAPARQVPATVQARGKGRKGGTSQKQGGKRRRHKEESYRRYIHRVLQQVHPNLAISSKAMDVMQSLVTDCFEQLAEEAGNLTRVSKRATLSAREVQTAVRLALPGELGRHAIEEGKKAVLKMSHSCTGGDGRKGAYTHSGRRPTARRLAGPVAPQLRHPFQAAFGGALAAVNHPPPPSTTSPMLPAFGGSGNLLVEQELLGGAPPREPIFLGTTAAGAGAAADPGFFVEPGSPAAGALGRQPFSPGGRRSSGLGMQGGLGSGGFGSGWVLGPSGSLAPGSSRDLVRELECHEDLFLPSAPSSSPPTGAAPTIGVTVVPAAAQQPATGTSPPTPPTLPSGLRWHEALAAFQPLPPSAVPPPQPLHTETVQPQMVQAQPHASAAAGYGMALNPVHVQLARPQPPALFVTPPTAPSTGLAPAPDVPMPTPHVPSAPIINLPSTTGAVAAPSASPSPAASGSASSMAAGGSVISGDNVPRIASLPNLHLRLQSGADSKPKAQRSRAQPATGGSSGSRGGGSKGAKEKMLPRARSHNDLAAEGATPRAPAPGTSTAEVDAAPPSSLRFSVPHLPYLVPPHLRKGKGGRQPAPDPRLDPRIDPKKARRIMANRLSAAKSKLKNKSAKQAQTQRAEMLRLRRDELAAEVEEAAASVAHEEAEQAELRQQVQALEQQIAAQRLQHSPFETSGDWLM